MRWFWFRYKVGNAVGSLFWWLYYNRDGMGTLFCCVSLIALYVGPRDSVQSPFDVWAQYYLSIFFVLFYARYVAFFLTSFFRR
jgi:hypothetical protein